MPLTENNIIKISRPFFSVVITTYNRETLLMRALESLLLQKENDWEAIIIDDGSTDNTSFQIQRFLKKEKRLRYKYQENMGSTLAKNQGINASSGKYITFLDSDDEYKPHHLSLRKKILEENPQIDFLYGGVKVTGNPFVPDMQDYKKMIHLSDCVIGGNFFIKKELISVMEGFADIPLGCDADLFNRIQNTNAEILKVSFPTYIYHRESADSITNNLSEAVGNSKSGAGLSSKGLCEV